MSPPSQRPARARSLTEKKQRRDDILGAAEQLWATTSYAELSMGQVASAAKLAKGTLYLYFDTKEDLFLALVDTHLNAWIEQTAVLLGNERPLTSSQLADVLVRAGHDSRSLRRLLVLLGTVLERRVRPELLRDFCQSMGQRLEQLLGLMPLERPLAERVLRHLYALAIGWQQLSEEPDTRSGPSLQSGTVSRSGTVAMLGLSGFSTPEGIEQTFDQEFELAVRAVIERLTAPPTPA